MEVILDEEEVEIDVVPLATKSLSIVDWKIYKEEKKSYYQIVRADGKSQMYRIFSQMLKSFTREDLEDLYKLVKAKYGSTRPVDDLDLLLWGDLKIMFEPHIEDQIMPPNMTTQSAGRSTATPRGGRTGGRTGRGSGRTRGLTGDLGNGGLDEQCGQ
ncbi:hypothetical protein Tco_1224427, partial [Tanacetum coccineum]